MTTPQKIPKLAINLPAQSVEVDMPHNNGVDPNWYATFRLLVTFAQLFNAIDFNTAATGATFHWDATNQRFTLS
jgi:hypothetical protein